MRVYLSLLGLLLTQLAFGQDLTKDFYNKHKGENSRSYFLYKSTLRSFSDITTDDFNRLIKDIEKISIYALPNTDVDENEIESLLASIDSEGFKIMKQISNENEGIRFYKLKDKNKAYIGVFSKGDHLGMVKLDGELDLKYVGSLRELNPDKLKEYFDFENMVKELDFD